MIEARLASPHIHQRGWSSTTLIWLTVVAIVPADAWGVWIFGVRALLVLACALAGALVGEAIVGAFRRRVTIGDGSAFLSGLVIGSLMPVNAALFVPIAASLFAMIVVKGTFGGLGNNWMSASAAGQVFGSICWSTQMAAWGPSRFTSWPTGTPVIDPFSALLGAPSVNLAAGSFSRLGSAEYPMSPVATSVSTWLTTNLNASIDPHVVDFLVGFHPGFLGAVGLPCILLGGIFAISGRLIDWRIPVAMIASFLAATALASTLLASPRSSIASPLFGLTAGSVVFAAFFLAQEPGTFPVTPGGMVYYGLGAGVLCAILQCFSVSEEAAPFAIIVMNLVVPFLDPLRRRRRARA